MSNAHDLFIMVSVSGWDYVLYWIMCSILKCDILIAREMSFERFCQGLNCNGYATG